MNIIRPSLITVFMLAFALTEESFAETTYGVLGFATVNADGQDGITGGMGGQTIRVSSREQLAHYASAPEPYTIIIEGRLEGKGLQRQYDVVDVASDKTIVGVKGAELAGIGLNIKNQQNIIIRNLVIHHADPDGIAARNSHHIWVDHCEVYSQDEPRREDWDGLVDLTGGSSYLTVSYCYLHDHHKACLLNSGTGHFEDNGRNRATYHHNAFLRIDQRCPRVGYGRAHVFCNYYQDIGNYAIGMHTQARVLSENNFFGDNVPRPFSQMYAKSLDEASCAFLDDRGSYFSTPLKDGFRFQPTGNSFDPLFWYDSRFALEPAASISTLYPQKTSPVEGLEYEPILWPGNGAIDQPTDLRLRYSEPEGMTAVEVRLGTTPSNLTVVDPAHLSLSSATTYYWQVTTANHSGTHTSPLYRFTTASSQATKPMPADKEKNAHLRVATTANEATRPTMLSWTRAAEANSYDVYFGTSVNEMEHARPTHVKTTSFQPGTLRYGQTYFWRVDAVKADDTIVKGDIWQFSAPAAPITLGLTEAEHLTREAYAYLERQDGQWFRASNDTVVAGEAGPGAMTGVWQGPDGTYHVSVTYYDESQGQPWIGLSVNDQLIEQWIGNKTGTVATHEIDRTVKMKTGDQIRIDFYTQGKARCRIDYITITPFPSSITPHPSLLSVHSSGVLAAASPATVPEVSPSGASSTHQTSTFKPSKPQ